MNLPEQYFGHEEGYLCMRLPIEGFARLPETLEVFDATLLRKQEMHVSLMALKDVAPIVANALSINEEAAKEKILDTFVRYVAAAPIEFVAFVNDFRFAEKDERKTVLVRCEVSNLEGFFAACEQEYGVSIPLQPTHVTLYTLQKDAGIGINTSAEMERLTRIDLPALFSILTA